MIRGFIDGACFALLCLVGICALISALSCAHMPRDLESWTADKQLKLAACVAEKPKTRSEGLRCLGPNFMRDLGDKTSAAANTWLSTLPEDKEGRRNAE